jgi:hypothetical protein
VVLVVRSGTTPNQAVLDALEQLADRTSLVLNQGRVSERRLLRLWSLW